MTHLSSCAVHNMPAYPAGPCDCGEWAREEAAKLVSKARSETVWEEDVAAALIAAEERGRIVGLREAYELVPWIKGTECADASDAIHARLTELEKATG